jgi:hypothetical protein
MGSTKEVNLVRHIPILDEVLNAHTGELGDDLIPYRNHTYRVVNFCVALSPDSTVHLDKIALAAAFHDLGIWTDHTFDYIPPSIRLARAHLTGSGQSAWTSEITEMIFQHHKLLPYQGVALVEHFRRADLVDVSKGLIRSGLSREFVNNVVAMWPTAGFHRRLVLLGLHRLRTHPLSPLPMIRL